METLGEMKCKEEMEVNIVEYRNNDISFKSFAKDDPDATEYSSSFADSSSDVDRCSGLSEGEVEMQMFDENGYASSFNAFSSALQLRKKKLTNHYRSFIRPLMWRCKWTELRIKEIESQATKYSRSLEAFEKRKLSGVDPYFLDEFGSKSFPLSTSQTCRGKQAMKRRKRKKDEEKTDVISYMTQHNLFSYLETKTSDLDAISLADDFAAAEKNIDDDEKFKNLNEESTFEFGGGGDRSMEQILSKIEGVHSRLHKLKNQMDTIMSKHAAKFSSSENLSLLDTALTPALSAGHGEAMSVGAVNNPAKDGSDCVDGEVVMPESAISSYDGVVSDAIKSSVVLLTAAEVNLPQSQTGDSGECIMEGVSTDQKEENNRNLKEKATASDDQPSLKSRLASNVNFPSKRKRGERRAGFGGWKKRRSSKLETNDGWLMRKRRNWFSAMKSCCVPPTKKKPNNVSDNRGKKAKKGVGKLTQIRSTSFIPRFKEPSSVEKIFSDFEKERENVEFRPPIILSEEGSVLPPVSPLVATSPVEKFQGVSSIEVASPKISSPKGAPPIVLCQHEELSHRRENVEFRPPILSEEGSVLPPVLPLIATSPVVTYPGVSSIEVSSPKISSSKAASPSVSQPPIILCQHEEISHRPEPASLNYHASATKIQAIYRGHMARRSFRALKGLVRLQGVVSGQNVKWQTVNAMKQMQRVVRMQSQIQSWRIQELENQSQHLDQYKNDKEVQSSFSRWSKRSDAGDHKNWDDSSITKNERDARVQRKAEAIIRRERAMSYVNARELWKDPPKSTQETPNHCPPVGDSRWCNWLERQLASQTLNDFSPQKSDNLTPKSLKSTAAKPEQTPPSLRSSSPAKSFSYMSGFSRHRPQGGESLFDDADSLVSCPPFTGPHYMSPTISYKAKERAAINRRERLVGSPRSESHRRLPYPLTPVSKFAKASNNGNKISEDNQSLHSMDNSTVASPVSLPARVGRRPLNRFV